MFRTKCLRNWLLLFTMLYLSATGAKAANILFISADGGPNGDDVPIVNYLEAAGHIVTVLADEDVAAQGEALALANDAVIASESSGSGNVANLRKDIEVPLVCLEYYAWDDFGMVTGEAVNGAATSTDITIVSPGHYLAAGFTGNVPVLTSTGHAIADSSAATIGSEAIIIAEEATYGDIIFVYEKGSTLADGSVAAEIRLAFGFGRGSYAHWTENTFKLLEAVVNTALDLAGPAINPQPTGDDVLRDVVLSWSPAAEEIVTYELFFGTSYSDVNNATAGAGISLDVNSYDVGQLEYGQTYYWRVDGSSDTATLKGIIWSFTIEPYARPISGQAISATASSQAAGQGPEKTIDGSGLDANDLHSAKIEDMWATVEGQALPAWIQYEFDKTYKLNEMLVWNYNGVSFLASLGLQDVTVEYSTDGVNWILNNNVSVFNMAPGADDYAANTTVPFGDVSVKYVKITVNSNWGGEFFKQYGLSEVRFLHVPVSARMPNPEDGATEVAIDVTLGWRAGREAAEHNVYISGDEQAVIGGTAAAMTVDEASYGPLSLDLASTYYWRVDEVNNANTVPIWEGGTWSFTTSDYLIVDDFESYNDILEGQEGSNLVYLTWIDGYDNPSTNGSTMGYVTGISMETSIVHNGRQSVPVMYDNSVASLSEVTVNTNDLAVGRDWTVGSPEMLVLWVYGDPNNATTEQMYVKINDAKIPFDGDLTQAEWHEFTINLTALGVSLNNVATLTIGFERTAATGGSGTVFIDDIWLVAFLE